jgi:hypothetical protein
MKLPNIFETEVIPIALFAAPFVHETLSSRKRRSHLGQVSIASMDFTGTLNVVGHMAQVIADDQAKAGRTADAEHEHRQLTLRKLLIRFDVVGKAPLVLEAGAQRARRQGKRCAQSNTRFSRQKKLIKSLATGNTLLYHQRLSCKGKRYETIPASSKRALWKIGPTCVFRSLSLLLLHPLKHSGQPLGDHSQELATPGLCLE